MEKSAKVGGTTTTLQTWGAGMQEKNGTEDLDVQEGKVCIDRG